MNLNDWVAVSGATIAVVGVLDSAIQRYKQSNKAKYAAERDFGHLKRNQEQMSRALDSLLTENDQINLKLVAIETQVKVFIEMMKAREND